MRKSEAIAPSDKRVVQTLLWALKPLSNLRRSIPLPYAITFLTVALEEGRPVGAYARDLDLNRYVMSRYMQCIGEKSRNGGPGLGLDDHSMKLIMERVICWRIPRLWLIERGAASWQDGGKRSRWR